MRSSKPSSLSRSSAHAAERQRSDPRAMSWRVVKLPLWIAGGTAVLSTFPGCSAPAPDVAATVATSLNRQYGTQALTCPESSIPVGQHMTCKARLNSGIVPVEVHRTSRTQVDVRPEIALLRTTDAAAVVRSFIWHAAGVSASVTCGSDPVVMAAPGTTLRCSATAQGEAHEVLVIVKDDELHLDVLVP
jgi:hypothetical protein